MSSTVPVVSNDYDGMMDALVDIKEEGDNMMAGIWWQKEILDKLEVSLVEAEQKMEAAERRNEALGDARTSLEAEVAELEARKQQLVSRMTEEEQHIVRLVTRPVNEILRGGPCTSISFSLKALTSAFTLKNLSPCKNAHL